MRTILKIGVVLGIFLLMPGLYSYTQVSINTDGSQPDSSAMLDVKSMEKGILIPRMNSAQRNAISTPATGLLVYGNDSHSFWYYNGTEWIEFSAKIQSDWNQTHPDSVDFIKNKPTIPVSVRPDSLQYVVNDTNARNVLPHQKIGMLVYVRKDSSMYELLAVWENDTTLRTAHIRRRFNCPTNHYDTLILLNCNCSEYTGSPPTIPTTKCADDTTNYHSGDCYELKYYCWMTYSITSELVGTKWIKINPTQYWKYITPVIADNGLYMNDTSIHYLAIGMDTTKNSTGLNTLDIDANIIRVLSPLKNPHWDSTSNVFIINNGNTDGFGMIGNYNKNMYAKSVGLTSRFEVQTFRGDNSDFTLRMSNNDDYAPFYIMAVSRGSLDYPQDVINGTALGGYYAAAYHNSSFRIAAGWLYYVHGTISGDTIPVDLVYSNNGCSGGIAGSDGTIERLRILANGNVGIGTDNPVQKLQVNGKVRIDNIPTLGILPTVALTVDANGVVNKYAWPTGSGGNDSTWTDNGYSAKKQTSKRDTVQMKIVEVTSGVIAPNFTLLASDTSVAVKGKSVFINADSSYYDCRSTTAIHKWWKRKY